VFKDGGIKIYCRFGIIIEPQKWGYLLHLNYLSIFLIDLELYYLGS